MSWTLHPASEFARFQHHWRSLNDYGVRSPLLETDFVSALIAEFANGNEVFVCHETANQIDAMGFFAPKGRAVWESFQPSQAPVGLWICRPGITFDQLLPELLRKLPGFPLMIGVLEQDPLLMPRPVVRGTVTTLDYIQTAKIGLQGSFDAYWNARGKNLRQNMKKQRNKLAKEGISLRLECATAPQDVEQALKDYGALESVGWKAKLGTAIHPENAQGRFYRCMLESFCARGAGRIYRYRFNDRIVAMDLCIQNDTQIIILKTTYDESIKDGTSPAFLLREEQIKELFDEGKLKSIEFYGKVMDWHLKWTEDVRQLYHVNAYRYPILSRVHGALKKSVTVDG